MASILVVEDEEEVRAAISALLTELGHQVQAASDGRTAGRYLAEQSFDLVITDLVMPDRDGFELLMTVRAKGGTPVILITGRRDEFLLTAATKLGAAATLQKPFSMEELLDTIGGVLTRPPEAT